MYKRIKREYIGRIGRRCNAELTVKSKATTAKPATTLGNARQRQAETPRKSGGGKIINPDAANEFSTLQSKKQEVCVSDK
jgi:hypothetical protein